MKKLRILLLYRVIIIFSIIIVGITYIRINKKENLQRNETKIIGIVNNIKYKDTKIEIELLEKEKILVTYYNEIELNIGDKIEIDGNFKIPENERIPNSFNYKKYLKSKKINYIYEAKNIKVLSKSKKIKYNIKNKILKHINTYDSKNYLSTFILADNEIDTNINKIYQKNGVCHLFAVSGMHIEILSLILRKTLDKISINEHVINIIISLFLIFFLFLTNYQPSILRATIMYILNLINLKLNLKIKNIYILLLTLDITLINNPYYIYSQAYIYSFAITLGLILYKPQSKNYIKNIFEISLVAFLISIPITINSNNRINIISPLINIIYVPVISKIVFPLSLLTLIIHPLDIILTKIIYLTEQLSIILDKVSMQLILSTIPWYITIIYYILIILFLIGIKNKQIKKIIPLIIFIIIHANINKININKKITLIDVGQGDANLIEINSNAILIDTGGNYNKNISENNLIPLFHSKGIKKLNYLILSHGDFDHMGDAINLVNNFKVEKVIFNCGPYNDLEQELIEVLDNKKIPYYSCIKELNIDNNKLYFLQTKEYDNENDNSNVIYTELNGYKFMFMGDAGVTTEKEIIDKYNLPDIDVLKVGHHGSKTSSSKKFINEISPKYSIISVGKNNRYGHPKDEVLETLKNSKIYRTDIDGSIEIKLNKNGYKIRTCPP